MSNRRRTRWLLAALAVVTVAGFVAYDFRDRLPRPYDIKFTLEAKAAETCAALPKPGREGRYQDYPACPWTVSVGPKQEFSGIISVNESGAYFSPIDTEPQGPDGAGGNGGSLRKTGRSGATKGRMPVCAD
jgi:hypothetical protein